MPNTIPASTLDKFTTFGDLLRFLRRRAGLTQLEFSIAVGYSDSQISRLEQNMRLPDPPTIEARFVPALYLQDEPMAVARLMELAGTIRREDAPARGLCPYKGLDYFDESDSDLFIGREASTEKLAARVIDLVTHAETGKPKFIAIVGASGSGKSSLVRAGLIPALRWNKISAGWQIFIITPSSHPLESLAVGMTQGDGSLASIASLMDDLARDPRSLSLFLKKEQSKITGSHTILVIDQFEELFSLCRSESERTAFINNLMTAASNENSGAMVVITLRADFYASCANYPQLREAMASQQVYIGAMSDEEMRRAVEEPARRGQWEFEPGLVDLILHDVGHEPGALPLLSHALLETWLRRHARRLTLSGYTSAGGVRGAIAETAEAVFRDRFSTDQQEIARRIFLRLTELGNETGTGDTRRQIKFSELIQKSGEAESIRMVVKALTDARLLTTSEDSIQVAHEALIREWPTLRGWLEDNREGLRLHRQLTVTAQDWIASEKDTDLLFRGARLEQVREWCEIHAEDLNTQELEFLNASIQFSEREIAEREAAHQRELETAQKLADTERQRADEGFRAANRLKRRSILATSFGILALFLLLLAIIAWRQSATQAAISRSLSLAGEAQQANQNGSGDLALALALESVSMDNPPIEAVNILRSVAAKVGTRALLKGHIHEVRSAVISPDNHMAFSGSCRQVDDNGNCLVGELILWDLDGQKEIQRWSAHAGWVNVVAFSTNGQTLFSGAEDGSLVQWDLSGKLLRQFIGHRGGITGLVMVENTASMLSGSEDGYLIHWDLENGHVRQRFEATSSPITAIALAARQPLAVSTHQDGSIYLWDLNDRSPVRRFRDQGAGLSSVGISPQGRWIIFANHATADQTINRINSYNGALLNQQTFGCVPGHVALDAEAAKILVDCTGAIIQMDIEKWSIQWSFTGTGEIFTTISISQDGQMGLSASRDGSLRVWNLGDQLEYRIETLEADALNSLSISSDGKTLLLNDYFQNGYDQPALWDVDKKAVVKSYFGTNLAISPDGVKFSPDDRLVAMAGFQQSTGTPVVKIWDLVSNNLGCNLSDFRGRVSSLAFTPDNRYLLTGSQVEDEVGGELLLWNISTCELVRKFDTKEDISSIAFNANGTQVITGSGFLGRIILWDFASGKQISQYAYTDRGPVLAVAFGPDDATILGSGIGEIYLWEVDSGDLIQRYTGLSKPPWSLDISPDGRFVLSGTLNGEVLLWDFASGEEVHRLNTHLGIYSVVFSPDGRKAYAASIDGKLVEWDITEKNLPELLDWIRENRYVRELTCDERLRYHVEPLCER